MSNSNKDLILQLIQQDLKHNQLTEGLRHLGLSDDGLYCIDLLSIIERLMEIPDGETGDRCTQVYVSFMCEAHQYGVSDLGKELKPVAEKCYDMMVACLEIERRISD